MATNRPTAKTQPAEPHRFVRVDIDPSQIDWADGYTPRAPAPPPPPERSALRAAGDLAVQLGAGAASGARMITDLGGANNTVSRGLRSWEDALRGLQSAAEQNDQQRISQIMDEAEGKGWGEQVMAGLRAFSVAPGAMVAEGLGTAVPTLATALIPGGQAAVAARLAAMGAAQGTGATKGAIYDEVNQNLLQSGATPEQAQSRAAEAQSYTGPNAGQIALGGALGGVAGATGIERMTGALRRGATSAHRGGPCRGRSG